MLIKGNIYYKKNEDFSYNDLMENSVNFIYNGEFLETSKNRIDSFTNKKIEVSRKNNYNLWNNKYNGTSNFEKFLNGIEAVNGIINISEVEFNEQEKLIALNYLKNTYPTSIGYSDVGLNTINDYLPYDYCGLNLESVINDIQMFLDGNLESSYYQYLDFFLGNDISSFVDYDNENNQLEDVISYCVDCFKHPNREGLTDLDLLSNNMDCSPYNVLGYEFLEELEELINNNEDSKIINQFCITRNNELKNMNSEDRWFN